MMRVAILRTIQRMGHQGFGVRASRQSAIVPDTGIFPGMVPKRCHTTTEPSLFAFRHASAKDAVESKRLNHTSDVVMDLGVCRNMFSFRDTGAADNQEESMIKEICSLFNDFCLNEASLGIEKAEAKTLDFCRERLTPHGSLLHADGGVLRWYPRYAAVLFESGKACGTGMRQLHLIGLDQWTFDVHRGAHGHEHEAHSNNYALLNVGDIQAQEFELFLRNVDALLDKSEAAKRKETRNAAFLHAVMTRVREKGSIEDADLFANSSDMLDDLPIKGGFTDVGLHTGGKHRNTAWPLFAAAVQVLMEQYPNQTLNDGRIFFMDSMCKFQLFLAAEMVSNAANGMQTGSLEQTVIDRCMSTLRQAAFLGADVAELGRDMGQFIEKSMACRVKLEMLRDSDGERIASSFELSEHDLEVEGFAGHCMLPNVEKPSLHSEAQTGSYKAMCEAVCKNIGWIQTPIVRTARDLVDLHHGCGEALDSERSLQFRLRVMERAVFQWFLRFSEDDTVEGLAHVTSADLRKLIQQYREANELFNKLPEALHHMQSELRSRETLFVWVVYCFVHAHCVRMEDHGGSVREFGVALRWTDLNHLVLSDKLARDTCLAVCTYLRTNHKRGKELFHLSRQEATFDFAFLVSQQDEKILQVWKQEQTNQGSRVEAHWNEVERKQKLANALRGELLDLRKMENERDEELKSRQNRFDSAKSACSRCRSSLGASKCNNCETLDDQVFSAKQHLQAAKSQVNSKEKQLEEAEKAPGALIENLPSASNERLALQVLFFMHMPKLLLDLSEITMLAQERLLPPFLQHTDSSNLPNVHPYRDWNVTEQLEVDNKSVEYSWLARFNSTHNYSPSGPSEEGTVGCIQLRTDKQAPGSDYGPRHVDHFRTKMCGVWYPNDHCPTTGWLKNERWMDPFAEIPEAIRVICHTEKVAVHSKEPGAEKLQWAMAQLCASSGKHESASRGNWAIVLQDLRPAWLTKHEFLEFGCLRAYPLQQLRKLCIAIKARSLPFSSPAVHVLLKQALFHLGDLRESDEGRDTTLLWKKELLDCEPESNHTMGLFRETLLSEMQNLKMELKEKPREHKALLLLGEIASHLAEYHPSFRYVALECGRISEAMAYRCDEELEKHAADPALARTFRRKRKLLQLHAIMSFSNSSQLDACGARDVVRLLAMAQNGAITEDDESNDEKELEIERLTTLARNLVAFNMSAILAAVLDDQQILTMALQAVVQSGPGQLLWKAFDVAGGSVVDQQQSSCFYARDGNDLYALNILTGQILFNGNPIRGLPNAVLDHALYRRVFGKSNFEVKEHGHSSGFVNTFETTRYIKGRYLYKFAVAADGALVVQEFDSELQQTLELLDGIAPSTWGRELPERLQHMHSHWYSRELEAIIFRSVDYREHAVPFLGVIRGKPFTDSRNGASDECPCQIFEIPLHSQQHEWTSLMQPHVRRKFEHLVLCKSPLIRTLAKFEDPAFIHTLSSHDKKSFRVSFPRYKLDLVLAEDSFRCKTYDGYNMETCQQLQDTMFGFTSYLLLQLQNPADDVEGRSKQLVLVPRGKLTAEQASKCQSGKYVMKTSERCDAELTFFAYEVHPRFQHLQAASVDARLFLAAIYAATGSELPEVRLETTGAEHATMLVRQSWTNEPLTTSELDSLQQISDWSYSSPTLSLLCQHLMDSSESLGFLYPGAERGSIGILPMGLCPAEVLTCYYQERKGSPHHARRALTSDEEQSFMGIMFRSAVKFTQWRRGDLPSQVTSGDWVDLDESELSSCEDELQNLIQEIQPGARAQKREKQCIADLRTACHGAVGTQMVDELEKSYYLHAHKPVYAIAGQLETVQQTANRLLRKVTEKRAAAEKRLLSLVNAVPNSSTASIRRFQLMQTVNEIPVASLGDIAQFAVVDGLIEQFNPLLDRDAIHALQDKSLLWLQWCTLEDRLERILAHTSLASRNPILKFNQEAALEEIQSTRTWNVKENPDWLLFEVEGRIRIRPRQMEVVKQLLENPGSIVQLNMGEGKTRIILPMIWLHLSRPRSSVVRSHFLTALLSEAKEYMQRRLTASLLCRRVYLMPFNRDVELSAGRLQRMSATLASCQRNRGMLMLAPEHRLSLHLKCRESQQGTSVEPGTVVLHNVMDQFRMHDVFDESDVVLHHNYQLVYAMGVGSSLPSGASRWHAAQALLRALAYHPTLLSNLTKSKAATLTQEAPGASAYPRLQLNAGKQLADEIPVMLKTLASAVLTDPPHEFKWMLLEQDLDRKDSLLSCMVGKEVDTTKTLKRLRIPAAQQDDILALRGFLAHGVMEHCLKKRFRVEYGLKRSRHKHLAVPYLAADTPSERSEFQHADCQILMTILAHYYDGLVEKEVKRSVEVLLRLGPSARQASYNRWLEAGIGCDMDEGTMSDLDSVDKLDLSNTKLLQQAFHAFRRNPETINFYLNNCVLPQETTHYQQTLRSSAWDLADNDTGVCRGFSGTNDLHTLLPQQVHQLFTEDPELSGTNGKMVQLILRNSVFLTLPTASHVGVQHTAKSPHIGARVPCHAASPVAGDRAVADTAQWARVLSMCLDRETQADALIDAGGLMAGVSNQHVAEVLVSRSDFPEKFRGVTFYCVHSKSWKVIDRDRSCQPKHSSPIRTQDTFAFFDESRCRGADLKLRQDACAVLTVGEKMCKDKLMQAAGRMRQLASGQQLKFLGTHHVADNIAQLRSYGGGVTSQDLLCWVMQNTVQALAAGLTTWANKGSAFFTTKYSPQHAVFNEEATLNALYAQKRSRLPAAKIVKKMQKTYLARMQAGARPVEQESENTKDSEDAIMNEEYTTGSSQSTNTTSSSESLTDIVSPCLSRILDQVTIMGEEVVIERSALEEECEREVEQEEEQEEEVERLVARAVPNSEEDWDYGSILQAKSVAVAKTAAAARHLPDLLQPLHASEMSTSLESGGVAWSKTIWGTSNFWCTLQNAKFPSGDYLRPVDVAWQFPSGELLLLSEREADSVMRLLWTGKRSAGHGHLRHLGYLRRDEDAMKMLLDTGESEEQRRNLKTESSVCLQLLNGDTMYHGHVRRKALQAMLAAANGELEACWMVQVRGRQMDYPFSDLENIKYADLLADASATKSRPDESTASPDRKRRKVV